jgi:hypothetical protein
LLNPRRVRKSLPLRRSRLPQKPRLLLNPVVHLQRRPAFPNLPCLLDTLKPPKATLLLLLFMLDDQHSQPLSSQQLHLLPFLLDISTKATVNVSSLVKLVATTG